MFISVRLFGAVTGNLFFERDQTDRIVITCGANDFDFDVCLEGGQTYETPVIAAGYTDGGFGNVTRNLHRYEKKKLSTRPKRTEFCPLSITRPEVCEMLQTKKLF
ncbi:MAG: hypothetical protein L6V93_08100 [Clostridiales bacterium]|nr:MAG: hypothetical protein L6V93_08100 [Clostridiales bacterium]